MDICIFISIEYSMILQSQMAGTISCSSSQNLHVYESRFTYNINLNPILALTLMISTAPSRRATASQFQLDPTTPTTL